MSELERARETELEYLREELAARERELDVAYKRIDRLIRATRHLPDFRQIMRESHGLGKAGQDDCPRGRQRMRRFVIHSEERGIYLGDSIDRDFFALDDERGEWDVAITFASERIARSEAAARFPRVSVMVVPVEIWVDANAIPIADKIVLYATIEECAAAGLPAWDVRRGDRAGWQGSRARVSVARRR